MTKIKMSPEAFKELYKEFQNNPVGFAIEICGINPYDWQIRFLNALLTDKFIVRPSGHGTGKTTITAVAMLWMLFFWEECHIRATSATFDQLKSIMWDKFKNIIASSAIVDWIFVDESKAINRMFPFNWARPLAWSKDKPQAWAGEHCKHPIGVFDECSDVDDVIYESWSGSAHHTGSRTILLGQPRLRSGMLFKAANNSKYNVEHLNTEEIPEQKEFVEDARDEYGESSDYYKIRVLGQFPQVDNSAMFSEPYSKVVESIEPLGFPVGGLDVAEGGGDDSVLWVRRAYGVVGLRRFNEPDHAKLKVLVIDALAFYGCNVMAMDNIGVGYGLWCFLKDVPGLTVVPVKGSNKAIHFKKYHNKRAEAYGRTADAWKLLKFSNNEINADDLRKLGRQLDATKKFYDADMRICVLKKPEIKKELKGESPDLADALAYSFMAGEENAPRDSGASSNSSYTHMPPQDIWSGKSSQDIWSGKSSYRIW
ncbi:MAG: hypothetical protein LBU89_10950 [Fibromonadaceae bacterium]|jgi:hypothetical protein|nr:hypothetical protein [Fibromonadaceae bacterium]